MRAMVILASGWTILCLHAHALHAAGPAEDVPELKPLDRFAGSWTGTVEDPEFTSKSEVTWILGGKYLQQKYEFNDGSTGLIVRGYDAQSNDYVMTLFDSHGIALLMRGFWDEPTKTLTMNGLLGDRSVISKAVFVSDDQFDWSIRIEERNGQLAGEIKGTNKRTAK